MSEPSQHWLDQPRNIDRLRWALYGICALLLVVDLFYHKHGYFGFEQWAGFYAWYSLLCGIAVVAAARYLLRPLLKRDEGYYGD